MLHARLAAPSATARRRPATAASTVATRWRTWPAGRIFPARLDYTTALLAAQAASRVGISPDDSCAAALAARLLTAAARSGCRAALRASYTDELAGTVYTIGVLAFPGTAAAQAFGARLAGGPLVTSLHALAFPATASGRFTDAARQIGLVKQAGPFVVLAVAGYADGQPAAAAGHPQYSDFTPAAQLITQIIRPLAAWQPAGCTRPGSPC